MKNDPQKLDLLKPGIFLLIFLAILGGALFFLNNLDKQRKTQVYQQYKQETESYIAKNNQALNTLFVSLVDKNPCPYADCPQSQPIKDQIDHQLSHDLKDWSSTAFLVRSSGEQGINMVRLSGDITSFYSYPEDKSIKVSKLLTGEISELPWDEYTYNLPGKEVIIPIKNNSGQVVGAIVRGVIEDKSF